MSPCTLCTLLCAYREEIKDTMKEVRETMEKRNSPHGPGRRKDELIFHPYFTLSMVLAHCFYVSLYPIFFWSHNHTSNQAAYKQLDLNTWAPTRSGSPTSFVLERLCMVEFDRERYFLDRDIIWEAQHKYEDEG